VWEASHAEVLEEMPLVCSGTHLLDAGNYRFVSFLDREICHLFTCLHYLQEV
jgi:hypothetical protein